MPEFGTRPVTLRDARTVTLRLATVDDLPGVHAMDADVVRAGDGVVRAPEHLEPLEDYVARCSAVLAKQDGIDGIFGIAETPDGGVVAEGSVHRVRAGMCHHSATLALSVHPDFQGVGLGRAVCHWLLDWADTIEPEITRVGLFTRADNARAIQLYESLGFAHEGVRRKFTRLADGSYVDDIVMGRLRD